MRHPPRHPDVYTSCRHPACFLPLYWVPREMVCALALLCRVSSSSRQTPKTAHCLEEIHRTGKLFFLQMLLNYGRVLDLSGPPTIIQQIHPSIFGRSHQPSNLLSSSVPAVRDICSTKSRRILNLQAASFTTHSTTIRKTTCMPTFFPQMPYMHPIAA